MMLTQEQIHTYRGNININTRNGDPTRVFLGALGIGFLTWLLFTGVLQGLFASIYCFFKTDCSFADCMGQDGYNSATYFIFQLLSGACWVVGSAILFVISGAKFLYEDVKSAFTQAKAVRTQSDKIAQDVAANVLQDGTVQQNVNSLNVITSVDEAIRSLNERMNRKASVVETEKHLRVLYDRVKVIEDQLGIEEPVAVVPMTMEEMTKAMAELQERLKEKEAAPKTRTARKS